tara:strand:+ start:120 stop:1682 length:1563 start_codon:yes stop_codon:yes gene_type:complete
MTEFPFHHFLKADAPQNATPKEIAKNTLNTLNHGEIEHDDSDEIQAIESEILNFLKQSLPANGFQTYFECTFNVLKLQENVIICSVTTPFIKNMIERKYLDKLEEAVTSLLGQSYQIKIDVIESKNSSLSSNNSNLLNSLKNHNPKNAREASFTLQNTREDKLSQIESQYIEHVQSDNTGILIDRSKSFANFIVGPSNNLAYATAKAVGENPGKSGKYPSLYLFSDSGLGKTHLLHAIANAVLEHSPSSRINLLSARDFMREMVSAYQQKNVEEFRKKYTEKTDVLMIDDIHELKDKEGTQNEFFHVFNELHNKGKQLIFTSDKSPKEITGIEERVMTRLQWGLVLDIQRPDLETRIAILRAKATELDLFLHDDVINVMANSIKSSIRELEGALIKLQAYSEVMNQEIDVELAKELLTLGGVNESVAPTIDSIAKATSAYYKVSFADLKSKSRAKETAHARHVAMYLARKLMKVTQEEIGKFFGGRDHSSVIHAVSKIELLTKSDASLSKDLLQIENSMN